MSPRAAAELARDLVLEAGRCAHALQGKVEPRQKAGGEGPVTEADLAAERVLLTGLRRRYPRDAILSEESATDLDGPVPTRLWCVDPLDGTREFAAGLPDFAAMAGLLRDGQPVAGAFSVPAEDAVYWGFFDGDERGAWRNDVPIKVGTATVLADATAIHSRSRVSDRLRAGLDRLGIAKTERAGGVGYKVARLLDGNADLYLHAGGGTKWWDSVGPAAVWRAAGGLVLDEKGRPLSYDVSHAVRHPDGLLFVPPTLADEARRRLQ